MDTGHRDVPAVPPAQSVHSGHDGDQWRRGELYARLFFMYRSALANIGTVAVYTPEIRWLVDPTD
jgi:hypothetical protein